MPLLARLCLGCLLVGAGAAGWAEPEKTEVELTHWWTSAAEQAALKEIADVINSRGAVFTTIPVQGFQTVREKVLQQITNGYPPAVTQWLGGKNLLVLNRIHSIRYLPEQWRGEKLSDLLFPEVLKEESSGGKMAALPVAIHIQNTAFFNGPIYRELALPLPKSWKDVLEQAAIIKKAGYTPLALSAEAWQLRMLFNTILIEQIGAEGFAEFYDPEKKIDQWQTQLGKALATFSQLKAYVDRPEQEIGWVETVNQLANGKAAILVMGDFATGELTYMGKQAGQDFLCSLAPGSGALMVYAIDSFVMLDVEENYLKTGQDLLFDVVLDGKVQAAFNSKKGGIPVRKGIEQESMDACTRQRYQHWLADEAIRQPPPDSVNSLRQSFIETMVQDVWLGKEDIEDAIDNVVRVANAAVR